MQIQRCKILILLLLVGSYVNAKNYALLIGISTYPKEEAGSSWVDIHGTNDTQLLLPMLFQHGYDVYLLENEKANAQNIRASIDKLIQHAQLNDTIYFHFSGHGQPVEDYDGDELDGWDESIIPYDAKMIWNESIYEGENHIIDDELNVYFNRLRCKVGAKGLVVAIIDACHSGTMYREYNVMDEDLSYRGVNIGFSRDKFYRPKKESTSSNYIIPTAKDLANIIIIEACQAGQCNQEVKIDGEYYGSLSYCIYKNPTFDFSQNWLNTLNMTMKSILPEWSSQQLMIETNLR